MIPSKEMVRETFPIIRSYLADEHPGWNMNAKSTLEEMINNAKETKDAMMLYAKKGINFESFKDKKYKLKLELELKLKASYIGVSTICIQREMMKRWHYNFLRKFILKCKLYKLEPCWLFGCDMKDVDTRKPDILDSYYARYYETWRCKKCGRIVENIHCAFI